MWRRGREAWKTDGAEGVIDLGRQGDGERRIIWGCVIGEREEFGATTMRPLTRLRQSALFLALVLCNWPSEGRYFVAVALDHIHRVYSIGTVLYLRGVRGKALRVD